MDNSNYMVKSIELLQNKNMGIGFNRYPKENKFKKELDTTKEQLSLIQKDLENTKNELETTKHLLEEALKNNKKLQTENQNYLNLQSNNRKQMYDASNIQEIVNKNDDCINHIVREYLIMKEHIRTM